MCAYDGHISWLRIPVVFGCVLLNGKVEDVFLGLRGSERITTYVRAGEGMLLQGEN